MSNITDIADTVNATDYLGLLPMLVIVGMFLFMLSFVFGGEGMILGRLFHRWYFVIPVSGMVLLIPLVIVGGFNMWMIIMILVIVTIVGGMFFWWLEHDFELPKGDPVKQGVAWWKKKFRF